ncbi:RT30 protein, partial [Hippolais icterina]|nr:RT30 protein [Hippolais icterina]
MAALGVWRLLRPGRRWFSEMVPGDPSPPGSPLYPPVVASITAKSKAAKSRRLQRFNQRVHAAATVEEKLRLYGKLQRPKYTVYPQTFALNADRWYRTPEPGAEAPAAAEAPGDRVAPGAAAGAAPYVDIGELRSLACDALLQESFYQNKKRPFLYRDQDHTPGPFLTQLVSTLAASLSGLNPLLAASSLDLSPKVNYYWHHGEEVVVHGHRKGRVDPVRFQIDDNPHLQIRVPKQLPEVVPLESDLGDVPVIDHKPSKLPLFKKQYENKVFIGSKVADPCCYGHTQFHLLPDRLKRERFIRERLEDQIEVVYRSNGIASLFAWTAAQAMYQGFWSEADVTRPFVSQAVVTDGKYFAFFCYQLNTLALTAEAVKNNPRKNICWGTDSKPLYDVVEDGNVKGFNDEVLLQLVHFLLNRPKEL